MSAYLKTLWMIGQGAQTLGAILDDLIRPRERSAFRLDKDISSSPITRFHTSQLFLITTPFAIIPAHRREPLRTALNTARPRSYQIHNLRRSCFDLDQASRRELQHRRELEH